MNTKNQEFPTSTTKTITKNEVNAILGGAFVIISIGFYIAWDTYLWIFPDQWVRYRYFVYLLHSVISYHISFVVGAALAAELIHMMKTLFIYYLAGVLAIVSGVLLILPWKTITPVITARYIGGFAHGMALLTVIVHASEIGILKFRGRLTGAISLYLATLIFIGSMLMAFVMHIAPSSIYVDQLVGVLTVVFAVIALICSRCTYIDSPIYHLERNDTGTALTCLVKLRCDNVSSWKVNHEFSELEAFVNGERKDGASLMSGGNNKSFLRVAVLRALFSASTLILFGVYIELFLASDLYQYGIVLTIGIHYLPQNICIYLFNRQSRRITLLVFTGLASLLLLFIGCLLFTIIDYSIVLTAAITFIAQTLFLGLGMGPASIFYLAESFPLRKTGLSTSFALSVEQWMRISFYIIFLLVVWCTTVPVYLLLVMEILQILLFIFFYVTFPETKQLIWQKRKEAEKKKET